MPDKWDPLIVPTPETGDKWDSHIVKSPDDVSTVPGALSFNEYRAQQEEQKKRGVMSRAAGAVKGFIKAIPATVSGLAEDFSTAKKESKRIFEEEGRGAAMKAAVKSAGEAGLRGITDLGGMVKNVGAAAIGDPIAKIGLTPDAKERYDYDQYLQKMREQGYREAVRKGETTMLGAASDVSGITEGEAGKTAKEKGVVSGSAEVGSLAVDPAVIAAGGGKIIGAVARKAGLEATARTAMPTLTKAAEAVTGTAKAVGSAVKGDLQELAGKVLEKTGRGVEGVGKSTPAKFAQQAAPVAGTIAGLASGSAATALGTFAGLGSLATVLKRGGKGLAGAGEALQAWSRTEGGNLFLSRAQQIALDPQAPSWLRQTARWVTSPEKPSIAGAAARAVAGTGTKAAQRVTEGAVKGGAIMAPLAATTADTPEEAGAIVGSGAAIGGLLHLAMGPIADGLTKRRLEDLSTASWYSKLDPASKNAFDSLGTYVPEGLHREIRLRAAMVDALINGLNPDAQKGVKLKWLTPEEWTAAGLDPNGVAATRTLADGTSEILAQPSQMNRRTLGHEMWHVISRDPRIVDHAGLSRVLADQIDPVTGDVITKGLFTKQEMDRFEGEYLRSLDSNFLARKAQQKLAEPEAYRQWLQEEVAAELFGHWFAGRDGDFIKRIDAPTMRIVDAALSGQGRQWLRNAQSVFRDAFKLRKSGDGGVESDVFTGLKNSPELDAFFRSMVRNRLDAGTTPVEATGVTGGPIEGPRVQASDAPVEAVVAAFDRSEALGRDGGRLAQLFPDSDHWVRNPDGTIYTRNGRPVLRSPAEFRRIQQERVTQLMDQLARVPDENDPRAVRRVENADGTPRYEGQYFTDAQMAAIESMPPNLMPQSLKDKMRLINDAAKEGRPLDINYNPALLRNRYSSRLGMAYRVGVPIRVDITQAGNFLVQTIDLVHLDAKKQRWWDTDQRLIAQGRQARFFPGFESFEDVTTGLDQYIDNVINGRPGETNLHPDPAVAMQRKDRFNDLFNFTTVDTVNRNVNRLSSPRGEKDTMIRSRRFDRINAVSPVEGDPMPISYERVKLNLQPKGATPDAPVGRGPEESAQGSELLPLQPPHAAFPSAEAERGTQPGLPGATDAPPTVAPESFTPRPPAQPKVAEAVDAKIALDDVEPGTFGQTFTFQPRKAPTPERGGFEVAPIEEFAGKEMVTLTSDHLRGGFFTATGGEQVPLGGGPAYSWIKANREGGAGWASGAGAAKGYLTRLKLRGGPGLLSAVTVMAPEATISNRAYLNAWYAEMKGRIAAGQLDSAMADQAAVWAANRMKEGSKMTVRNPQVKTLDDFYAWLARPESTYHERKAMMSLFGVKSTNKGAAPFKFTEAGVVTPDWLLAQVNEPAFANLKNHIVGLVELTGESGNAKDMGVFDHPSYDTVMKGTPIAVLDKPLHISDVTSYEVGYEGGNPLIMGQPKLDKVTPGAELVKGEYAPTPSGEILYATKGATKLTKAESDQILPRPIADVIKEVGGGELSPDVLAYGDFMNKMREKGPVSPRDVVKSYIITISSIQRAALRRETFQEKWAEHTPPGESEKIRPEDATASLLGSEMGQRYLNAAEKGVYDKEAADWIGDKMDILGMGKATRRYLSEAPKLAQMAEKIHEAVAKMSDEEMIDTLTGLIKGVGLSKIGFFTGHLGYGRLPTIDSRELKTHYATPEGPVDKTGKPLNPQRKHVSTKVLLEVRERLGQLGIKVPPNQIENAMTLLHHELWDRAEGGSTPHAEIKNAMLNFQPRKKASEVKVSIPKEDVETANQTSRTLGAVGERAVTPRVAIQYLRDNLSKKASVLDFGAGKDAAHAKRIKGAGYNVTAMDFGANVKEGVHDPKALNQTYDLVYASNVLNTQGSQRMLEGTLDQLMFTAKPTGAVIANLPLTPRKGAWAGDKTDVSRLQKELEKRFRKVTMVAPPDGKVNRAEPVFLAEEPLFQPGSPLGDDTVKLAAIQIKLPDGTYKIVEGPFHAFAHLTAEQELGTDVYIRAVDDNAVADGFTTASGKFVTREEAFRIAKEAKQFKAPDASFGSDDIEDLNRQFANKKRLASENLFSRAEMESMMPQQ